ncbi:FG-GAP repeat domain-containing protein [Elioraea rosea]|uniref:FG-GAP repeat domain-containing protein n=1 Tax=Elioraea rosea TaxID=2492390 RepID=UPI0011836C77|nr:VCBS repeat-containing protein [Elioraea rosea]
MALKVSFGQGGKPTQWYLPGTTTALLPAGPPGGQAPVADALTDGPHAPGWDDTPLFGGLVEADTTGGTAHSFDVVGGWNSVKNAFAQSDQAEELRFDGFVQVDIDVGRGDAEGASIVTVVGAKRGNIVTGDGNDVIRVEMLSNEASWNNEFRIVTGGGDDVVELTGLDRDGELAGGDTTYAEFANGAGGRWDVSGGMTRSFVDLGAGNDRFIGHGSDDTVTGGEGDDLADGGEGEDVWTVSGLRDGYGITRANGRYIVTDVDHTANGDDGRDDIGGFEKLRFGDGSEFSLETLSALTLWNRLGNPGEAVDSALGPDGTLAGGTFVQGVFGGAWRVAAEDATTYWNDPIILRTLAFPSSVINAAAGTIEFWVRLDRFSGPIGLGAAPALLAQVPFPPADAEPRGAWVLSFNANDGGGGGGLTGAVGNANETGTVPSNTFQTYEDVLGGTPGDWHHIAMSWSRNGFGQLGQPDREVMLFIDGVASSTHWEERVLLGFDGNWNPIWGTGNLDPPYVPTFILALDGPSWPAGSAVEFDNLKVWSVAKTDFSDRFDEDAGAAPPADTASLTFADIGNGVGGFRILGDPATMPGGLDGTPIGDLNGDGIGEVLITGTFPSGASLVVWGKNDGIPVSATDIAAGIGGFAILVGGSIAAIDDRNGDGLDDILIGDPGWNLAYLVWGKGDGAPVTREDILSADGGLPVFGGQPLDFAGVAVGAIADLGGDGMEELIISAWPNLESFPTPGLVYIEGDGGFRIVGSNIGDGIIYEATLGDTNGDGRADLLLTGNHGAYVVWGRSDGADVGTNDLAAGTGGFLVPDANGSGGSGDLNGDGVAEVLVTDEANAYVIWGKPDGAAVALDDIAAGLGGFMVAGANALATLGADLNGDGLDELLAHDESASYVIYGKGDTAAVSLEDIDAGIGGFRVFGEGAAFVPTGDMNGDGLPELLATPPEDALAPSAYVVFSTPAWLA